VPVYGEVRFAIAVVVTRYRDVATEPPLPRHRGGVVSARGEDVPNPGGSTIHCGVRLAITVVVGRHREVGAHAEKMRPQGVGAGLQDVPGTRRWTIDGEIHPAVPVVIARRGHVGAEAELADRVGRVTRCRIPDEPRPIGRPENREVRFAVAIRVNSGGGESRPEDFGHVRVLIERAVPPGLRLKTAHDWPIGRTRANSDVFVP